MKYAEANKWGSNTSQIEKQKHTSEQKCLDGRKILKNNKAATTLQTGRQS